MEFDELSHRVIGCALEVHKTLGPGLLESTYEQCLAHELSLAGIPFKLQCPVPVAYKGVLLDCGYRVDLLVGEHGRVATGEGAAGGTNDARLIVELKSVDRVLPIHEAQLLTYMKLAKVRVGLLINFNVAVLKDGIKRMVL